jgi:hypothetical protein
MQPISPYSFYPRSFDIWALSKQFTLGVFFNELIVEHSLFNLGDLVRTEFNVLLGVLCLIVLLINML